MCYAFRIWRDFGRLSLGEPGSSSGTRRASKVVARSEIFGGDHFSPRTAPSLLWLIGNERSSDAAQWRRRARGCWASAPKTIYHDCTCQQHAHHACRRHSRRCPQVSCTAQRRCQQSRKANHRLLLSIDQGLYRDLAWRRPARGRRGSL